MEALLPLFPPDKSPFHWQTVEVFPTSAAFLATNCVLHVVVFVIVGIRFYSRSMAATVGWDDWWALFATVLTTCTLVTAICLDVLGLGYPIAEVGINIVTILFLVLVIQFLFIFSIGLTKLSVCCLYLRVFVGHGMRIAVFATISLIFAWVVSHSIAAIFICKPIAAAFDVRLVAVAKCGDQSKYFQSGVSINVVLDVILLILPLQPIWKLKMHTSDKIGLCVAFCIGIVLVVVGIIRAIYIVQVEVKGDLTGTSPLTLFLMLFEQQLAVIVISIPMLRPFWARYRNRSTGYNLDNDNSDSSLKAVGGSELVTIGGSGGIRSKKRSRRGMDDSILNTQLDDKDVDTNQYVGRSMSEDGESEGEGGRYHIDLSDGHSIASGWDSRGDAGSESRLDLNPSPTGPAVRSGGISGDSRVIEVTTE